MENRRRSGPPSSLPQEKAQAARWRSLRAYLVKEAARRRHGDITVSEYRDVLVRVCCADPWFLKTIPVQREIVYAKASGDRRFLRRLPGRHAKGVRPALTPQETELLCLVDRLRWPSCDGCGGPVSLRQLPRVEMHLRVAWLGARCAQDQAVLIEFRRRRRAWLPLTQDGQPVPCSGRLPGKTLVDMVKGIQARAPAPVPLDPDVNIPVSALRRPRPIHGGRPIPKDQKAPAMLSDQPETRPGHGLTFGVMPALRPARSLRAIHRHLLRHPRLRRLLIRPGRQAPISYQALRKLVSDGVPDRGERFVPLGTLHRQGAWAPRQPHARKDEVEVVGVHTSVAYLAPQRKT
jgi:hypothetical protein